MATKETDGFDLACCAVGWLGVLMTGGAALAWHNTLWDVLGFIWLVVAVGMSIDSLRRWPR